MKKQINQLRMGVILSYLNLVLGSLIPFFYTPVMLRILGQAEYGLYSLSSSAISYLTLLSFGFGSTIIRYIAKYRAERDKKAVENTFGFFLILYSFLSVLVMLAGITIANNVEPVFHRGLTAYELDKVHILILIMTFNTALSFPVSVFSSLVLAYEKYIFRRLVDMLSTVIAPIANLIALYLGFASVGMAVASTILQLLMLPLNIGYCFKCLHIKPRFSRLPRELIHEMLGFSVYIFLGTLVDMLFWSTDKVILGMLTSSVVVAVYNVGGTFNNIVMNLSTSISTVLTPRITGMVIKEATNEKLTELFIRVGRIQYFIIALIISGFTVFGQTFIKLWAGSDYLDAYWIAILTLFPLCIPLIQNTGMSIVVAQNKHQFRAKVYFVIAVVNVISTYIVVPYLGGIGAAICSCISYLLGQGLIMNIYYYKITGIDIPAFWRNIAKMSIIPACMMGIGLLLNKCVILNNWFFFFVNVIIYTIIYCILMYCFILNNYEKDVVRRPINKLMQDIRAKNRKI